VRHLFSAWGNHLAFGLPVIGRLTEQVADAMGKLALAISGTTHKNARMDQNLLHSYLATVYEFQSPSGLLRVSLDGDSTVDPSVFPDPLTRTFAVLTAYNPRSMLLPRRVNDARHQVLRDLLILGVYRVDQCVGVENEPDGMWREPAWFVHNMDRVEAESFGRVFRQNTIIWSTGGRPMLIVTDPTCDELGRVFPASFRMRA